jgi:acetylornithine/N-succinyldiaminopimelate aminotransferase
MPNEDIRALDELYVLPTYKRFPGVFVRGLGCSVWDEEGNEYLDFLAGIAVCQLGHCHPAVVKAIEQQARTLIHTSNFLLTPPQAKLARELCRVSGMEKVFFTVDGTSANETSIKLAKKHGLSRRPSGDYEIITLRNSFHGRSLGSLSATAQSKYQDQFKPLLPGFVVVPLNDVDALRSAFNERTAAITFEPIQGEGGVTPVTDEFAHEARKLTEESGPLLIIDEVQTGIGRTGEWFAYQHFGFKPDVLCVAKGLGGGVPIGACLTRGLANDIFVAGDHGATFGGNPLSAAAGLAVLETLENEGVIEHAAAMGRLLSASLLSLGSPVVETRGKGLMIGVKLSEPIAREAVLKALERKLIINATDDYTLRLVPPLIIQPEHIGRAVQIIGECIGANALATA